MGTNTLTGRTDGEKIPANDHNELVQALLIDLVPRNNSRVPQDIIGQLGTSALRWLRTYTKELFVGDAANNLKIYEGAANELWLQRDSLSNEIIRIRNGLIEMYIAGSLMFTLDATGINGAYMKGNSIPQDTLIAKEIDTGTATGSVGGSLVEIASARCTINCIAGRTYLFGTTWTSLTGVSATVRMNVIGVSQSLLELTRSDGATSAMGLVVAYTAVGTGSYQFQIYGQNWTVMTNMRTWAKEA